MWTNADHQYPYDIMIDEVILYDSTSMANGIESLEFGNLSLTNFPNPFTDRTTILYEVPSRSELKLSVYNLLGQEVAMLYEGVREAGTHSAELNVSDMNSNMLICKLECNNQVVVKKMTLLK